MTADAVPLTDDDRKWLARCTIGRRPVMDWLATDPPADTVRAHLVKILDRAHPGFVVCRVLADHIGADPNRVYAENWPRKAAKLARSARDRGDHPHADQLHAALIALMYCANCGRPLLDPVSIERGIGPDCWERIPPQWRQSISDRLAAAIPTEGTAA
jgi:uncharacterized protein DUF6011